MRDSSRIFSKPFVSALLGGIVVGALCWVAFAIGLIEGRSSATTTLTAPAAMPVAGGEPDETTPINRIYESAGDGIAFIEAERSTPEAPSGFFGPPQEGGGTATGSGFVIDSEGHVLTNHHVVAGADEIRVKLGDSEETYEAELVGSDPATDLALLDLDADAEDLNPLPLGRSSELEVGDPVVAIGNPFGLDRTVTSGIVSALQRQIESPNGFSISDVIQTDAAINPGNSGGPLINGSGEAVGVNSQIESTGGGNVGIGFAVPIDTAREVISQLLDDGEVRHAFLGITGASIDSAVAGALNLPVDSGVLVQEVVPGGPADEAGISGGTTSATIDSADITLGGDIIVAVDGRPVASMEEVIDAVNGADPGDRLELTVLADGERQGVTVTLADRPDSPPASE